MNFFLVWLTLAVAFLTDFICAAIINETFKTLYISITKNIENIDLSGLNCGDKESKLFFNPQLSAESILTQFESQNNQKGYLCASDWSDEELEEIKNKSKKYQIEVYFVEHCEWPTTEAKNVWKLSTKEIVVKTKLKQVFATLLESVDDDKFQLRNDTVNKFQQKIEQMINSNSELIDIRNQFDILGNLVLFAHTASSIEPLDLLYLNKYSINWNLVDERLTKILDYIQINYSGRHAKKIIENKVTSIVALVQSASTIKINGTDDLRLFMSLTEVDHNNFYISSSILDSFLEDNF